MAKEVRFLGKTWTITPEGVAVTIIVTIGFICVITLMLTRDSIKLTRKEPPPRVFYPLEKHKPSPEEVPLVKKRVGHFDVYKAEPAPKD
jgi:hypothetical protein